MDIAEVQKILGHENIATTQLYAVMDTSVLRKKFHSLTENPTRQLLQQIQQLRRDQVTAFASDLLHK